MLGRLTNSWSNLDCEAYSSAVVGSIPCGGISLAETESGACMTEDADEERDSLPGGGEREGFWSGRRQERGGGKEEAATAEGRGNEISSGSVDTGHEEKMIGFDSCNDDCKESSAGGNGRDNSCPYSTRVQISRPIKHRRVNTIAGPIGCERLGFAFPGLKRGMVTSVGSNREPEPNHQSSGRSWISKRWTPISSPSPLNSIVTPSSLFAAFTDHRKNRMMPSRATNKRRPSVIRCHCSACIDAFSYPSLVRKNTVKTLCFMITK
ncbi:hypothetical protein BHE74_00029962 [Ensete ventricosum]|nr:hypothetical protein BHE74_00029962 [Ensete ventricosum]